VLFHNGMPNSRLMYEDHVTIAVDKGVKFISYDRPGYGGSDPQPGRTVGDCAADVRAISTALGIERLGVIGWSGGGPHALACAALVEDVVPAVVSIASVAPDGADGLDYFSGMGEHNVKDIKQGLEDPAASRLEMAAQREQMLTATADQLLEMYSSLYAPVDAAVMTGDYADFAVATLHDGLAPGDQGWWDDGEAIVRFPWGFDPGSIRTPVLLSHGRQDRFVPFAHGEWLASRIPGVESRLTEDDGHMTFMNNNLAVMLDWILERL
jgi:pimeloyl-ACP methyl ester carboxylesterase